MDEGTKSVIERWLVKADNDLRTSLTMLEVNDPPTDTVCFHAQQCAEKALKAYLVSKDEHVERTHSIPRLVELCRKHDESYEQFVHSAPELTVYAVAGRYPDDWVDITEEDARLAIDSADAILRFVKVRLGHSHESNR